MFEHETAAIAARTCHSEDSSVLVTDFSCAYPSVDRRWIFIVLQRAGVPEALQALFREIHGDPTTKIEHAGGANQFDTS